MSNVPTKSNDRVRQAFEAWRSALSKRKFRPANPFHDHADFRQFRRDREDFVRALSELRDELEAWDAASDEDFERFEDSLE